MTLNPKFKNKLIQDKSSRQGTYLHIDDLRAFVTDIQYNNPDLQGAEREKMNQVYLTVLGN